MSKPLDRLDEIFTKVAIPCMTRETPNLDQLSADFKQAILDWVSEEVIPKKKKPSDPKYHNKHHKPDEDEIAKMRGKPFINEDGEEEHRIITVPNSMCYMTTTNDGYNQAIAEMRSKLTIERSK